MRVLIISAALLVSAPAVAQQAQQSADSVSAPQAAPVQAQKPQEKKICKRVDAVESRLGGWK